MVSLFVTLMKLDVPHMGQNQKKMKKGVEGSLRSKIKTLDCTGLISLIQAYQNCPIYFKLGMMILEAVRYKLNYYQKVSITIFTLMIFLTFFVGLGRIPNMVEYPAGGRIFSLTILNLPGRIFDISFSIFYIKQY